MYFRSPLSPRLYLDSKGASIVSRHIWVAGLTFAHCLSAVAPTDGRITQPGSGRRGVSVSWKLRGSPLSSLVSEHRAHAVSTVMPLCSDPRVCPSVPQSQTLTPTAPGSDGPVPAKAKCYWKAWPRADGQTEGVSQFSPRLGPLPLT